MKEQDAYDFLYKIILVGDANVGKTHLLSRYIRGSLPSKPKSTIGVEFATRTVPLQVGGTVKAQIWDTAGQERYRAITSAHYRRAVGALLVYDITNKNSFINTTQWLKELQQNAESDIIISLVGNKLDLVEENAAARQVPYEVGARFAQKNGLFFSETSAVSSHNVKHVFEHLLQEIYNQKSKKTSDETSSQYNSNAYYSNVVQLVPPEVPDKNNWLYKNQTPGKNVNETPFSILGCCQI